MNFDINNLNIFGNKPQHQGKKVEIKYTFNKNELAKALKFDENKIISIDLDKDKQEIIIIMRGD